jgi:GDP-L-fucose synthase
MNLDKDAKIYVAGHTGMVGSAILRRLINENFSRIITKTHEELDLINQNEVSRFFAKEKPDYVFISAAKVGGIYANDTFRGQFLYENLMIQNNIINSAKNHHVKKLLFLGSACVYPRLSKQPIKEEYLLSGFLEPTNEPYAIAKIAGIKLCENYFRQYNCNFISAMPNNLYGINDNFNLKNSHVLPALMLKFYDAKLKNKKTVEVWGTGLPKREFLYVDDMVDACIFLMKKLNAEKLYGSGISNINIGSGEEISIRSLALMLKKIIGFKGKINFNSNYPDGVPRKLLNISKIEELGWSPKTSLKIGIEKTFDWFVNEYNRVN